MARPNEDPEWENPTEEECIMYDLGYLEGQKETEENMLGLGVTHIKAVIKLRQLHPTIQTMTSPRLRRLALAYFRGRADARRDKLTRQIKGEVTS